VVIACRSEKNGTEAVEKLKKDQPEAQVTFMQLDLGNFASIRKFVADYKATKKPLHILVNNAGVMACPRALTSDGLELQFGTNHIGHFLLTTELLDVIKASGTAGQPARIINLSSIAQYFFAPSEGMRLDDLKAEKGYDQWDRYGSSKLANNLFTKYLHRQFIAEKANVIAVSVHPGVINETNLGRHMDLFTMLSITGKLAMKGPGAMYALMAGENKNIKQGRSYRSIPDVVCFKRFGRV
jgi:NAD(P)-dependent dehydrogenase (short-subunit alcohol dehydrogenase family)